VDDRASETCVGPTSVRETVGIELTMDEEQMWVEVEK